MDIYVDLTSFFTEANIITHTEKKDGKLNLISREQETKLSSLRKKLAIGEKQLNQGQGTDAKAFMSELIE